MKRFNYYLSLMLLLVFTAACNDEFDQPPMVIPTAEHTPNMTIAEFKAKHWQDDRNYIDTVTEDEVIHGWVTSSDESGNIYKCLYIMDESGAGLAISINQSSLYNNYRLGQEIVLPMKGLFVGKYNGQQQLGYPEWYAAGNAWEATFLPQAMWESVAELNGLPDVSKIDTLEITISDLKTDAESMLKYQGRLVRINGVTFDDAGEPFAVTPVPGNSSTNNTNRNITDENGNSLIIRNSGYADFRADILPESEVDVVGLVGCYGTTWQMYLRSASDVITGNTSGTKRNPFNVAEALQRQNSGSRGWVAGYVVGAVAPEVTAVKSNADIEWSAPTVLDNTLVIADDPECKDYTKCVIVPLPQGSYFREEANLRAHSKLLKKRIKVKGSLESYMGAAGVIVNTGAKGEYELPVLPPETGVSQLKETFDSQIPADWSIVTISGDKPWFWYSYPSNNPTDFFVQVSGYNGNKPPYDNWLITPALDIKNAKSKTLSFDVNTNPYNATADKFEVYILDLADPNQATVKEKLNPKLPTPPASTWSEWTTVEDIDLSAWADGIYYIAFRYYAEGNSGNNYMTWRIDNVSFGYGDMIPATRADFETMGTPQGSKYDTFTSTKGWVASNSLLFQGGVSDAPPVYQFISYMTGSETKFAMAPTLNGKTTAVGTIKSPTLSGGMKKLSFNYGAAFSDKSLAFRIDVKQNGNVVKSWTVNRTDITSKTAYTFEQTCDINGDFTIEITNLCPSASTGNKDRVSIWNLVWEQ